MLDLGRVEVADFHVAGQAFRIVTSEVPRPEGRDGLEKRIWSEKNLDDLRRLLVNEPRGRAGLHGCFAFLPEEAAGSLDVVPFDEGGFAVACGQGAIALAAWTAQHQTPGEPIRIDTPPGRIDVKADVAGDSGAWTYVDVPAYVSARFVPVQLADDVVSVDIVYAGIYLAFVDSTELGIPVTADNVHRFGRLGREIGLILGANPAVVHPTDHRLSGLYGTVFYETSEPSGGEVSERAITVTVDGRVDRSPCGTSISARLALLDSSAELNRGRWLQSESVIGARLAGTVVGDGIVGGLHGVVPQIRGRAHSIATSTIWFDDHDPLGLGFQLRD